MNYYAKMAGFIILGYLCLWFIFIIAISTKLYIDQYGYPTINILIPNY
jgi:hypothetical protein